jgi:hypothetical protein
VDLIRGCVLGEMMVGWLILLFGTRRARVLILNTHLIIIIWIAKNKMPMIRKRMGLLMWFMSIVFTVYYY